MPEYRHRQCRRGAKLSCFDQHAQNAWWTHVISCLRKWFSLEWWWCVNEAEWEFRGIHFYIDRLIILVTIKRAFVCKPHMGKTGAMPCLLVQIISHLLLDAANLRFQAFGQHPLSDWNGRVTVPSQRSGPRVFSWTISAMHGKYANRLSETPTKGIKPKRNRWKLYQRGNHALIHLMETILCLDGTLLFQKWRVLYINWKQKKHGGKHEWIYSSKSVTDPIPPWVR